MKKLDKFLSEFLPSWRDDGLSENEAMVIAKRLVDEYRDLNNGVPLKFCPKTLKLVFENTGKPFRRKDMRGKSCLFCGLKIRKDGCDACLGKLPGVKFACCGHGREDGYILFKNGIRVTTKKLNKNGISNHKTTGRKIRAVDSYS